MYLLERVHMRRLHTFVLSLWIFWETDFICHVDTMMCRPRFHEWPIKEITIVRDKYMRLHIKNVVEKSIDQTYLK